MKHLLIIAGILLTVTLLSVGVGCNSGNSDRARIPGVDSLQLTASNLFHVLPSQADNPENPVTAQKVALGKRLYFDTRLSAKGNNSCNSCHNLASFGVDNKPFSIGDDGKPGGRNSPTVLNAALHASQFWDGRAKDVEEQAGMPILNPVEMHMTNPRVLEQRLRKDTVYKRLFAEAFPGEKNVVNYENLKKAIGAFERTLLTPSKFDEYLGGNSNALTEQEKKGLHLFINTGCTACHADVALGGQLFQKFGLYGNYWDFTKSANIDSGRFLVTKNKTDMYFFKVPSLRNSVKTYPYYHDGSVASVKEAVSIMARIQSNKTLTDEETDDVVSFLNSLTGKVPDEAVTNPFMK